MFSITIDEQGFAEIGAAIIRKRDAVRQSVDAEILRQTVLLHRYVITGKLQGQVLHHRTGNLQRNTIFFIDRTSNGVIGTVGTTRTAPYGKVHEYGGNLTIREHPVREHLRTSKLGRRFTVHTYTVRAHTAHFPERSYLRSALKDRQAEILSGLQSAIMKGLAS